MSSTCPSPAVWRLPVPVSNACETSDCFSVRIASVLLPWLITNPWVVLPSESSPMYVQPLRSTLKTRLAFVGPFQISKSPSSAAVRAVVYPR